ncbi:NlpC/P60 family protein [Christiangramia sediminis]|uniref:NlpC/P60 family protein n=1 Tax=Christiangramia sediminis TaxID=2881336 RepID=A0A9X1RYN6_9FLAO|nr:NlpC/P60 family protein [Christiangramia sediminis]MCB7481924.1 NlpC/P60 family protein [Christiangramia sediminis]
MNFYKYILAFLMFAAIACNEQRSGNNLQVAEDHIEEVRSKFAPDKRIALFNIDSEIREGKLIVRGETNMAHAKDSLFSKLDSAEIEYIDSIQVLPASNLNDSIYGIIDVSVANLRGEAKHSAELVTQATLGTPVDIWKRTDEWYYIQTPDGYLSWVDHGGITTMNKYEFEKWKSSEKIIFQKPFGQSFKDASLDSKPVTDLVAGAILEMEAEKGNFYKVRYPDGRAAFISKDDSAVYSQWLSALKASEENLMGTAEKLMGVPYLWGGTSAKGVDCSGFTKTIFFMNGMVIPRDASQQIREGKLIDSTGKFEKLAVGDLLFFGRPATDSTSERVVHVGMWLGNNEFIHSSGDVHISSMDSTAENFDDFNKNRYLRTKRYLDQKSEGLTYLKSENIYMTEEADTLYN